MPPNQSTELSEELFEKHSDRTYENKENGSFIFLSRMKIFPGEVFQIPLVPGPNTPFFKGGIFSMRFHPSLAKRGRGDFQQNDSEPGGTGTGPPIKTFVVDAFKIVFHRVLLISRR